MIVKRWMETLNKCLCSEVPFVVYREQDSTRAKIIIQTQKNDSNFANQHGFVFVPFEESRMNRKIFIGGNIVVYSDEPEQKTPLLKNQNTEFKAGNCPLHVANTEEYCSQVASAVEQIKKTKFQKTVLSHIHKEPKPEGFDVFNFFEHLCKDLPSAFCYVLFHPLTGLWCGASPELLLKYDGAYIETVALAGTRSSVNIKPEEADWKEKEILEQQFVSDYIADKLQKANVKEVLKTGPVTAKAGNLFHLKTFFKAKVNKSFDFIALAESLHPTPAVCGLPLKPAMDFIRETETHNRAYYAGYLGPVNIDLPALFHVNLRCMQVFDDALALYVGAGITEDSDPLSEWNETCRKAETLLKTIKNNH